MNNTATAIIRRKIAALLVLAAVLLPPVLSAEDRQAPDFSPRSAGERREDRLKMVEHQIASPKDGRPKVKDPLVLEAMRSVPRHKFVPKTLRLLPLRAAAYSDGPLPIGHDQTISQPYIVALMTELLEVKPGDKVLEIGTGSGYQAAVLAHITPHVYSIEIIKPLAERAEEVLRAEGYESVKLKQGDGFKGWPEHSPYDSIIVTFAAPEIPPPLWEQLKAGGRMVIPLGEKDGFQVLQRIRKTKDGAKEAETITPVRFVPMLREGGDKE